MCERPADELTQYQRTRPKLLHRKKADGICDVVLRRNVQGGTAPATAQSPTLPARQLQQLFQERIAALPGIEGLTDVDLGGVVWREASAGQANWTVPTLRSRDNYKTSIAQVIRQVQELYDLEE